MRTGLAAAAVLSACAAAAVVLLRDPGDPLALPLFVGALAVAAGAAAAWLLLPPPGRARGRPARTAAAVRRGLAVGAAVGLLAGLRAVDGLTPITAAFVVGGFALAEVALTARAS